MNTSAEKHQFDYMMQIKAHKELQDRNLRLLIAENARLAAERLRTQPEIEISRLNPRISSFGMMFRIREISEDADGFPEVKMELINIVTSESLRAFEIRMRSGTCRAEPGVDLLVTTDIPGDAIADVYANVQGHEAIRLFLEWKLARLASDAIDGTKT